MVYVFELNQRYDIDGGVAYNHARLINHSCNPNCEVEINNNQIWISTIKNIKKNAELTYNYGYSYDADYVDHVCKCGSYKCVGYILDEDHWSKLKGKKKINPQFTFRLVSKYSELLILLLLILQVRASFYQNLLQ